MPPGFVRLDVGLMPARARLRSYNYGLLPSWRAAIMMMLRSRAVRASIIGCRSAGATRQNPLVIRSGKQNDNFFGNGRGRMAINVRRAIDPLNGRAWAHVAGLIR